VYLHTLFWRLRMDACRVRILTAEKALCEIIGIPGGGPFCRRWPATGDGREPYGTVAGHRLQVRSVTRCLIIRYSSICQDEYYDQRYAGQISL